MPSKNQNNISKEIMSAISTPLILQVITQEETYGYEIKQKVKEVSEGNIIWQDGSLYPVLKKLEKKELIRSKWRKTPAGKKRKYYSITNKGLNALKVHKDQWDLVNGILLKLESSNTLH